MVLQVKLTATYAGQKFSVNVDVNEEEYKQCKEQRIIPDRVKKAAIERAKEIYYGEAFAPKLERQYAEHDGGWFKKYDY